MIIAIDGPSGTGKSTAARSLARKLGFLYLDTGAMYRAVALAARAKKISLDDEKKLAVLAGKIRLQLKPRPGGGLQVLLDGADVTRKIRHPAIGEAASVIAAIPGVRRALVRKQQAIGARGKVVAEGRDTTTVVFPKADLKVFLTASAQARARRRFGELKAAGHKVSYRQVLWDLRRRDKRDKTRKDSPLKAARGALRVDNTSLQADQVFDILTDYVRRILYSRKRGCCFD